MTAIKPQKPPHLARRGNRAARYFRNSQSEGITHQAPTPSGLQMPIAATYSPQTSPPIDLTGVADVQALPTAPEQTPPASDGTGDDRIGQFRQGKIGDCWLASSMAAVAQDPDGAAILSNSITRDASTGTWHVTFAGDPAHTDFTVTQDELSTWPGMRGDTDAAVMEIAASKWFKQSSRDHLIQWAGTDPVKQKAVNDFLGAAQKVEQTQSAIYALYQQGRWSPSLVEDYETAVAAAQAITDRLTGLASDRDSSSVKMQAHLQISVLDGGQPLVAFDALTGATGSLSILQTQDDLFGFLSTLAADPDGITATLGSPTDPRTNQPWYADRQPDPDKPQNPIIATPYSTIRPAEASAGHGISVVAVDAKQQTITFRDPNHPDEPFTMSWEEFGQWYFQQERKPLFTSMEVQPPRQ